MRIDFSPPDITEAEIAAVAEVLRSGWITTGQRTKELERRLAQWCGTPKVACLSSATAALECALRLLGIGPGDEVITSAYTYTASASVIYHVGATPVLIDVAPGSYQMDYDALAAAVTPRTKAIIPVDIAGIMCNYDRLLAILREPSVASYYTPASGTLQTAFDRVPIIADAAHSFGATYRGQPSGAVADFTAFSFHAVKNLTTAEGGALTWRSREASSTAFGTQAPSPVSDAASSTAFDDEELYHQLMLLSLHGQSKDALAKNTAGSWDYDIVEPYYKCNMTDMAAALGLAQFERYQGLLLRRRAILERYESGLKQGATQQGAAQHGMASQGVPLDFLQHYTDEGCSSGHLCLVRLPGRSEAFRNRMIAHMAAADIACNVHYKPLPLLSAYRKRGFCIEDYPNALAQYRCEISLPLHTRLSDEMVDYVIASFWDAYQKCVEEDV
ncbi:MAG: DegT/DnrJ/EryC1/StrS family aminotransferase [Coriobacteriales bacterium]|nr:DegT/DnrJ/EryC1/StrS family aminotransferase [Coriobacteriales bacterium]